MDAQNDLESICSLCCDNDVPGCRFQDTVDEKLRLLGIVMLRDPLFVKFLKEVGERRERTGIDDIETFYCSPGKYTESVTLTNTINLTK